MLDAALVRCRDRGPIHSKRQGSMTPARLRGTGWLAAALIALAAACAPAPSADSDTRATESDHVTPETTLDVVQSSLADAYEYSVILDGVRADTADGTVRHFHRYRVVEHPAPGARDRTVRVHTTDWAAIPPATYEQERGLTGLMVLRKHWDGTISAEATPPLLGYVGDPRYGRWSDGDWQFNPDASLLVEALDEAGDLVTAASRGHLPTVRRSDYERYTRAPLTYGASARARAPGGPPAASAGSGPVASSPRSGFAIKVDARVATPRNGTTFVDRAQARERSSQARFDAKVQSRIAAPTTVRPVQPRATAPSSAASRPTTPSSNWSRGSSSSGTSRSSSSSSRRY